MICRPPKSVGRSYDYLESLEPLRDVRIGLLSDWLVQEPADEPVAELLQTAFNPWWRGPDGRLRKSPHPRLMPRPGVPLNGRYNIHDFKTDIETYLSDNPPLGIANLDELMAGARVSPEYPGLVECISVHE